MSNVIIGKPEAIATKPRPDGFVDAIVRSNFIDDDKKSSAGYKMCLVSSDKIREYSNYCRVLTEKEAQLWRDGFFDPNGIILEAKKSLLSLPDGSVSQKTVSWKSVLNKCADIKAERFQAALEKESYAKISGDNKRKVSK